MPWSLKLARIAGIDVYVHATFLLLLGWIAFLHWSEGRSLVAVLAGVGFILALFACVVLHEFGHALTARRFGIKTRDITLLPIGGLARLERMPERPRQELWVALAGPAVNVAIVVLLFAWLQVSGDWEPVDRLAVARGSFLERLMMVNVALAGFNLLPAFPMDGGRALRALLATRMDYARATQIAATTGQGMAILFGFVGLLGNPVLLFVALFVWIGASQEAGSVQMKAALAGVPVQRAMLTHYRTLTRESSLQEAVDLVLTGSQQDFPVVHDGLVEGMLTRRVLVAALAGHGRDTPVIEAMQRTFEVADVTDTLEPVLVRMQAGGVQTLPVLRQGRLAGLVTLDNIGEFLMIQAAEQQAPRAPRGNVTVSTDRSGG